MDRYMNGWMDAFMGGWMDGWTNGRVTHVSTFGQLEIDRSETFVHNKNTDAEKN